MNAVELRNSSFCFQSVKIIIDHHQCFRYHMKEFIGNYLLVPHKIYFKNLLIFSHDSLIVFKYKIIHSASILKDINSEIERIESKLPLIYSFDSCNRQNNTSLHCSLSYKPHIESSSNYKAEGCWQCLNNPIIHLPPRKVIKLKTRALLIDRQIVKGSSAPLPASDSPISCTRSYPWPGVWHENRFSRSSRSW